MASGTVAGLLLAAGAGRRFGRPKALVELDGEPLLRRALRALDDGGCAPIRVVLGAQAEAARELLPDPDIAVVAEDWDEGMGASLRAGLRALARLDPVPDAALVQLVDTPHVGAPVIARLLGSTDGDATVVRAAYEGAPGHPVCFGSRWWPEIIGSATGDRGARAWLRDRDDLRLVECGDLGRGTDVDSPEDLPK
jgi:nicotine blue oxidoreductase